MATLYATSDRARFFLVPDEARLPEGPLVVRSLTGRKLEADPVALDVYEIPEAEAMRHAQAVLGGFADSLRAVTMSAAAALTRPPKLDAAEVEARATRVAEHLKLGREQLRQDPAALGGALKAALGGMVQLAREAGAEPAAAEARMRDVAEALRQEGAPTEAVDALEKLPEQLRSLLASEELLAGLDSAAESLRAAAAELRAENEGRRAPGDAGKEA